MCTLRACGAATAARSGDTRRPKPARPTGRRSWAIRPTARPHSTPKGRRGYDRKRKPTDFDEAGNA